MTLCEFHHLSTSYVELSLVSLSFVSASLAAAPGLDGFEVIARIRAREEARGGRLPVIASTARSRKEDRERCLAAGMDDFLAKPIRADALWAAIERVTAPLPERP